jgi:hypothetical protein
MNGLLYQESFCPACHENFANGRHDFFFFAPKAMFCKCLASIPTKTTTSLDGD